MISLFYVILPLFLYIPWNIPISSILPSNSSQQPVPLHVDGCKAIVLTTSTSEMSQTYFWWPETDHLMKNCPFFVLEHDLPISPFCKIPPDFLPTRRFRRFLCLPRGAPAFRGWCTASHPRPTDIHRPSQRWWPEEREGYHIELWKTIGKLPIFWRNYLETLMIFDLFRTTMIFNSIQYLYVLVLMRG